MRTGDWQKARAIAEELLTDDQRAFVYQARADRWAFEKYDENQPRDEGGRWTSGGGGGGGASISPAPPQAATGPKPVAGFRAGVAGRGNAAAKTAIDKWFDASPFKGNIQAAIKAAPEAQAQLGRLGDQIAKDVPGVEFKNPGVKTNTERILQKAELRGGAERVTDLARGGFVINDPGQVDKIVSALEKEVGVVVEDWRVTDANYADRALNVRFPNGLIGEVQLLEPRMAAAKITGHALYERARTLDQARDATEITRLTNEMRTLYGNVINGYSPAWKAALGIAGS